MTACIIGVGNRYRGDDGAGPRLVDRLRRAAPEGVCLVEASGEGAALLEAWATFDLVYVVDAAMSGAPPGAIVRFDATRDRVPGGVFHTSTHEFSVAEAIELGRVLGRLPARLLVIGIEGADFRPSLEVSPEVALAIEKVASDLLRELAGQPASRPSAQPKPDEPTAR